jgi:hypothetical protein
VEKKGSHHKLAELLKNVRDLYFPRDLEGLCEEIKL